MAPSRWRQLIPFRGDREDTASGPSKLESLETPAQGLKVVAQGEHPVVDIVAIHGLNGHRDKTWTAANGVHWLRDPLPTDIPKARVFCWGYDANTHGERVSCQSYTTTRGNWCWICASREGLQRQRSGQLSSWHTVWVGSSSRAL